MSKIPYQFFLPIPKSFWSNGILDVSSTTYFKDLSLVTWIFSQLSLSSRIEVVNGKKVDLEPFEFIGKTEKCADECGLTVDEVRRRVEKWKAEQLLIKMPNSLPNKFTVYRWSTSLIPKNDAEQNAEQNAEQVAEHHLYINKNNNININKRVREEGQKKIQFLEKVELTQEEYDSLLKEHGASRLGEMLNMLNAHKISRGMTYKSDYGTLIEGGWVSIEFNKNQGKNNAKRNSNYQDAMERSGEKLSKASVVCPISWPKSECKNV